MCELLGFSSPDETDIRKVLKAFFAHGKKHPHGWGMMSENFGGRAIVRGAECAADSERLAELIERLQPQKNFLGHIRFATVGSIRLENCHPFTGRDITGREWTMIHNGTIYSGKNLYRYYSSQQGDTDSERLFMALLEEIDRRCEKGVMSEKDRFETVDRFIVENAPRNKLNLMIYDGELMYVHKNLKNTLSYKKLGNGLMFATEPPDDGEWLPFPMAQVIAYRAGKEVWRGERHKGVFVPTLDYITALDAMNI
ncbi:class II glutamine amidotransferase [Ruminococcus sp.]|uniref:class II glutamine amidotransferase n=1 Tax=Ruminococcus sp. TaxID=41978 RepID=UPI0025FD7974|nr:class II glutamine amidotransferase [Ruminococcus sp.]MBQ8967483.1 class II glutamine amidotransferase [Ruminococcus sp.]